MTFPPDVLLKFCTTIGFLGLALASLPGRRMRSTALKLLARSVRTALLMSVVLVGVLALQIEATQTWIWSDGPAFTAAVCEVLLATPAPKWLLLGTSVVVLLTLPLLALLDFAHWMSEATRQPLPGGKTVAAPASPARAPSPVSRTELQVAVNAMTKAASSPKPTVPQKRTVAELVQS